MEIAITNYSLNDEDVFNQYMNEIRDIKTLTPLEEMELFRSYKDGDLLAKDQLIKRNQRLIVSIAKRYFIYLNSGIDRMDLIVEGNLGLIRAIEKFDETRGWKFSTYATWWIRQAITRCLSNERNLIKVPEYLATNWRKIFEFKREFFEKNGIAPTDNEIIKGLEISKKEVNEFNLYQNQINDIVSLNMSLTPEDNDSEDLLSMIPDNYNNTEEIIISSELLNSFRKDLDFIFNKEIQNNRIKAKDIEIFKTRFGLNEDGVFITLEKTSQIYGVTRERVRQIEGKVIRLLRSPKNMYLLKTYKEGF